LPLHANIMPEIQHLNLDVNKYMFTDNIRCYIIREITQSDSQQTSGLWYKLMWHLFHHDIRQPVNVLSEC